MEVGAASVFERSSSLWWTQWWGWRQRGRCDSRRLRQRKQFDSYGSSLTGLRVEASTKRVRTRMGSKGKNCLIYVPPGTVVTDLDTGNVVAEILEHGEKKTLLEGGNGSWGN